MRTTPCFVVFALILPFASAGGWLRPAHADPSEVVAEVGGGTITRAQLEESASAQLGQLERQRHQILEQTLNQLVEQKLTELEAAQRGVSKEQLLQEEVQGKVTEITDQQVDAFFEENKARMRQPKEQIAGQIRQYLQQQQSGQLQGALIKQLKSKHNVKIRLEPMRAEVSADGAPSIGPADAPVTVVLYSDFQCPFCSKVLPTLERVKQDYSSQVRLAFRQFPLAMHAQAEKAAEASLCANEQGKFWPMHDAMFQDQQKLGVDDLKAKAVALELNAEQFNGCLDAGKYADQVRAEMAAGEKAGVTGTPAMFVNGRFVSGAIPYEQIAAVIDDELSRKGIQKTATQ